MIINIHGAIASGKTTLASNLRQFLKSSAGFDEPQINNPVLDLFYKDQHKWSFTSQLSFFNDLTIVGMKSKEYIESENIDYIVNDSSQLSNLVFSELLVEEGKLTFLEYDMLIQIAHLSKNIHKDSNTYNIVILKPVDEVINQLKKRGRDIELSYDDLDYFKRLATRYKELFERATTIMDCKNNTIFIDASNMNEKQVLQATLDALGINKKVERINNEKER